MARILWAVVAVSLLAVSLGTVHARPSANGQHRNDDYNALAADGSEYREAGLTDDDSAQSSLSAQSEADDDTDTFTEYQDASQDAEESTNENEMGDEEMEDASNDDDSTSVANEDGSLATQQTTELDDESEGDTEDSTNGEEMADGATDGISYNDGSMNNANDEDTLDTQQAAELDIANEGDSEDDSNKAVAAQAGSDKNKLWFRRFRRFRIRRGFGGIRRYFSRVWRTRRARSRRGRRRPRLRRYPSRPRRNRRPSWSVSRNIAFYRSMQSTYGPCSVTCGRGYRTVTTLFRCKLWRKCHRNTMTKKTRNRCNMRACPKKIVWVKTGVVKGKCSRSCGVGTYTITVMYACKGNGCGLRKTRTKRYRRRCRKMACPARYGMCPRRRRVACRGIERSCKQHHQCKQGMKCCIQGCEAKCVAAVPNLRRYYLSTFRRGKCSATCGKASRQIVKVYTCRRQGKCLTDEHNVTKQVHCRVPRCPPDAKYAVTSREVGACSVTCGVGVQTINAVITCTGKDCKRKTSMQKYRRRCRKDPCPVTKWGMFGKWSKCLGDSSSGVQSRQRSCSTGNPKDCPGGQRLAMKWRRCNNKDCNDNQLTAQWGKWSDCTAECGAGIQVRFKQRRVSADLAAFFLSHFGRNILSSFRPKPVSHVRWCPKLELCPQENSAKAAVTTKTKTATSAPKTTMKAPMTTTKAPMATTPTGGTQAKSTPTSAIVTQSATKTVTSPTAATATPSKIEVVEEVAEKKPKEVPGEAANFQDNFEAGDEDALATDDISYSQNEDEEEEQDDVLDRDLSDEELVQLAAQEDDISLDGGEDTNKDSDTVASADESLYDGDDSAQELGTATENDDGAEDMTDSEVNSDQDETMSETNSEIDNADSMFSNEDTDLTDDSDDDGSYDLEDSAEDSDNDLESDEVDDESAEAVSEGNDDATSSSTDDFETDKAEDTWNDENGEDSDQGQASNDDFENSEQASTSDTAAMSSEEDNDELYQNKHAMQGNINENKDNALEGEAMDDSKTNSWDSDAEYDEATSSSESSEYDSAEMEDTSNSINSESEDTAAVASQESDSWSGVDDTKDSSYESDGNSEQASSNSDWNDEEDEMKDAARDDSFEDDQGNESLASSENSAKNTLDAEEQFETDESNDDSDKLTSSETDDAVATYTDLADSESFRK